MTGNKSLMDVQKISDDLIGLVRLDSELLGVAEQRLNNSEEVLLRILGRQLKRPSWMFWNKNRRALEASLLFDDVYYLSRCPVIATSCINPVRHYLTDGAAEGLNPHSLFSTRWYLDNNPDVAASGINPLVHFIKFGGAEGRSPHPLFDSRWYLNNNPDVAASGMNPLVHFVRFGGAEGRSPHPLFDSRAYLDAHPLVKKAGMNPLVHYIKYGLFTLYKPHWIFDPVYYLRSNPEVVEQGENPWVHFMTRGLGEGREPNPDFRLADYVASHPGIASGAGNPLFGLVRTFGTRTATGVVASTKAALDMPFQSVTNHTEPEVPAFALLELLGAEFGGDSTRSIIEQFRHFRLPFTTERRDIVWDAAARRELVASIAALSVKLPLGEIPDVSIVIPVFNQLGYTLACLNSVLISPTRYSMEIIVADDCSTDGTGEVFAGNVGHIRYIRTAGNKGFIRNCNGAAEIARGRYLVFLNNDTIVLPGWLDELVGTLDANPDIGLAGSKLIYPDGRLQEAGGIIWRDASAWNFGRYDEPRKPEYTYMRGVDYVSGASIAVPRSVWDEMNGFDTWYDVAYGEDSDLALRIRQSGRRVVLQPLSMLIHFEGVSSGTDVTQGVKAYQVSNAAKMAERWSAVLAKHRPNGQLPILEKERDVRRRVLVIDHCTPTPDQDAGSLTCFEIMRAFKDTGFKVTFIPEDNFLYMPKETRDLQRIGIEAIYYPFYKSVEEYLKIYGQFFDVVLIFRGGAASRHMADVRKFCPKAKVFFHTSDLHFIREMRQIEVEGGSKAKRAKAEETKKTELALINSVDLTIVHSTYERDVLAGLAPKANVYVFPWILDKVGRVASFNQRSGLIFLGGYRHVPNVDAVLYFVSQVWPLIREKLPDAIFYAAGSNPPPELLELDGKENVVITGYIEDLQPYFERVRLSVAPIRYGAGIKGKVAMSMAYGVPVVATACAAEGMGLVDGENVVIEDIPHEMARKIVELYQDESRWFKLSEQSLAFVESNYDSSLGRKRVVEMVGNIPERSEFFKAR